VLIPQRQLRLKELLRREGICDVDSLSAELKVSRSTVRRDLEFLEQTGLVERTHGGVVWVGERGGATRPYIFEQRTADNLAAKQQIARAARHLATPGQTVLIDGGTTTLHLAREMLGQAMQIVTNSLPIADLFVNDEDAELVVAGGLMYPRYGVLLGPMTETALAAIHANVLFFSVAGVHEGALYNQNLLLVQSERRMMAQSQLTVLLADSSKFGQQSLTRLCGLEEVDVVVSDAGLSEEFQRQVQDANCRLIVAPAEEELPRA
jgi:DeoR family transcriptional regulator, fructose operon transcriptional repressor